MMHVIKLNEFFFQHIHVSEENIKSTFIKSLDQCGKFWLDNRSFLYFSAQCLFISIICLFCICSFHLINTRKY